MQKERLNEDMRPITPNQNERMQQIWQDHSRALSNPKGEAHLAAESFQKRFDGITPDSQIQKRLLAALMDAYRLDADLMGLPKYSKDIWFESGRAWGVEEQMRSYVEKHWKDYATDTERHLRGHTEKMPKCALCQGEAVNTGANVSFPEHDGCVIALYRKMKRLRVIDVRTSDSGIGYMWKPAREFQKIIDESLRNVPDHPSEREKERRDLLVLLGTLDAIRRYLPNRDIKLAEYLYLAAMVYVELMRNLYGKEIPVDKSFFYKMTDLPKNLSSFQLNEKTVRFIETMKKQLDEVS
jgi:hypothetical protein